MILFYIRIQINVLWGACELLYSSLKRSKQLTLDIWQLMPFHCFDDISNCRRCLEIELEYLRIFKAFLFVPPPAFFHVKKKPKRAFTSKQVVLVLDFKKLEITVRRCMCWRRYSLWQPGKNTFIEVPGCRFLLFDELTISFRLSSSCTLYEPNRQPPVQKSFCSTRTENS